MRERRPATLTDDVVSLDAVTRRRMLAYMRVIRARVDKIEREVLGPPKPRRAGLTLVKGDDDA